jgi:putative glutathione S-transferase
MNPQPETSLFGYQIENGEFKRGDVKFRHWVSREPGAHFPVEPGRYHLYVCLACPWSHRAVLVRKLRGLENVISMSVTDPIWDETGWVFGQDPDMVPDTVNGFKHILDLYKKADPSFDEPETVPVLWDKKTGALVNNESRDIMRMFDHEFASLGSGPDLCPPDLRGEIEKTIDEIYPTVNNGVYRAGFARSQGAYERACRQLFSKLDDLEARLASRRYLCGDRLTEADLALYVTLVRFEPVYYSHFKCNIRSLRDYPNLWGWLKDVYQVPGVAETTHFRHIKEHYYGSHKEINPTGIIPLGPEVDLSSPHGRALTGFTA